MIGAIFATLAASLGAITAAGFLYQKIGERSDRKRFPPPGKLFRTGSERLHLKVEGSGQPTVIFEAGIAATSVTWAYVQPEVAQFAEAVSYDRAGLGWSGQLRSVPTLDGMTAQLRQLLQAAGIPGPYILVGHSFGGLLTRAFACAWPNDVAGLVLVDPVSVRTWGNCSARDRYRLAMGARLSRRGAWLARLGVVRLTLAAAAGRNKQLTKAIAKASAGKATPMLGRLAGEVQKLPREVLPAVQAHWSHPKCFDAMAAYLESLPDCAALTAQTALAAGLPAIVLSAANATAGELQEREEMIGGLEYGRHQVVEKTGHWLHLERPEVVAAAVKELVGKVRSRRDTLRV